MTIKKLRTASGFIGSQGIIDAGVHKNQISQTLLNCCLQLSAIMCTEKKEEKQI